MDYACLITALTPAVDAAGKVILDIKASGPASKSKTDGSPVTLADQEAEKILLTELANVCPEIPVVSEENTDSHSLPIGQQFFLVDPLDGTKEFLKTDHGGAFTINIGLIDSYRLKYPNSREYSFWDYQAGAWQKDNGVRIDFFLISPEIVDTLIDVGIDKSPRGQEKPSDHTPIWIEIENF